VPLKFFSAKYLKWQCIQSIWNVYIFPFNKMLIQFILQFPVSVFNSDGQLMTFLNLITPYIRMLSSDWLMKGVFFFYNSYFFQLLFLLNCVYGARGRGVSFVKVSGRMEMYICFHWLAKKPNDISCMFFLYIYLRMDSDSYKVYVPMYREYITFYNYGYEK
jgi:hypothetical protein